MIGSADVIGDFVPQVRQWFVNTSAGRGVYDDQVQGVMLYEYNPMSNSYIRRATLPATSRQAAINSIMGFVGL